MLTVKQVAEQVRVSEATVRKWVASGQLAHYRLGARGSRGKIAVKPEDLEAFLAGCRVGPAQAAGPTARRPKTNFQHLRL